MKIFQNLLDAVCIALPSIFVEGYYADKVIQRIIKTNPKWGGRDRRFIAETTYEIVRNWRLYHEINGTYPACPPDSYAAIVAIHLYLINEREHPFVIKHLPKLSIEDKLHELNAVPAVRESVPDWLYERGQIELGASWDAELTALNKQADVIIRANTLKTSREQLLQTLKDEGIEVHKIAESETALQLINRQNLFTSSAFKAGLFEVQDIGSQRVAEFTKVKPGMRVIDACAGGGGKSLHLAALMENRGKIVAMDSEAHKLTELERRARRNGASIIECRAIENRKIIKRQKDSADVVLLDVPCSGSGVIRRNPDAKWKLKPETIENLKVLQADILDGYSCMVKPGGYLVYSTCSVFPSENREQINAFLQKHTEFVLQEDASLTPSKNGTDGFYFARMIKASV